MDPCKDPWTIGARRLLKTKADQTNQKPKSTRLSENLKDQMKFSFAVTPSIPPKFETYDIVGDLKEQISELTAMMEQLHRDHEATCKQLEKDMEKRYNQMKEEHKDQMREIQAVHESELAALEENYQKELWNVNMAAQEKLAEMQKEYKCLKNAFRTYQNSISEEMEEKWLRRQAEWKKSARTEREKALLKQKQALTMKFEEELEVLKQLARNNIACEQERDASSSQETTSELKVSDEALSEMATAESP